MDVDYRKIQIIMAEKLLNPTDLTRMTGMSPYGLYKVLNGKANPTIKTVGKICQALNIRIEEIIKSE